MLKKVLLAAVLIAGLALSCAGPAAVPAPPSPAPPSPAPPSPGKPDPRAAIIEQAKKEKEVFIVGSHAQEFMEELAGFRKKYMKR